MLILFEPTRSNFITPTIPGDGTVRFTPLPDGGSAPIPPLQAHDGPVTALLLFLPPSGTPGPRLLVTASADMYVKVWDLNTRLLLRRFPHAAGVTRLILPPSAPRRDRPEDDRTPVVPLGQSGTTVRPPAGTVPQLGSSASTPAPPLWPWRKRFISVAQDNSLSLFDLAGPTPTAIGRFGRHSVRLPLILSSFDPSRLQLSMSDGSQTKTTSSSDVKTPLSGCGRSDNSIVSSSQPLPSSIQPTP